MTAPVTRDALVAALARTEAWAKDEQAKRHAAEDKLVEARSRAALAEAAHQQVTAERDEETQRANEAVIRAGAMEQERNHLRLHFDAAIAAATNDELPANIRKTLAERVTWYRDRWLYATSELARLRAEGEAKDRRIALADRVKAQLEVAQNALCKIDRGGKPMRDIAAQALLDIAMVPYPAENEAARAATAREG